MTKGEIKKLYDQISATLDPNYFTLDQASGLIILNPNLISGVFSTTTTTTTTQP